MKRFLITIIMLFVVACSSVQYTMHHDLNNIYNIKQIDSICQVENIPSQTNLWDSICMRDEETKTSIIQYFYMVQKNDSIENVYTITKSDTVYKMKKRTTKKIVKK